MCGIAGIVDLKNKADYKPESLHQMAFAIGHRGPDEEGFETTPGHGFASRRLSIVGLADGRQPITNEDGSVVVVFNGELFDHVEQRRRLISQGHRFSTTCDTEVLVHLWEEHREDMLSRLNGQFAFALYDAKTETVILGRDRNGICPLHWTRQDDQLYFGSEIKAILASGEIEAKLDPRGLDHIFTFFAMPSRRTMFKGISSVLPGHFLRIRLGNDNGRAPEISEHCYWDLDFPNRGKEYRPASRRRLIDELQQVFFHAVETRLRADVPVVSYLSGGVDSATVVAVAGKVTGQPVPTFTVQIDSPALDESAKARQIARYVGSPNTTVSCNSAALTETYPSLVVASDCPVIDTSCSALFNLAKEVHRQGYKVALTGEGADEALAGYPWFKINRLLGLADVGSFRPSNVFRQLIRRIAGPMIPPEDIRRTQHLLGGSLAPADLYSLVRQGRYFYFHPDLLDSLNGFTPFEDLAIDRERLRRWHPLNQSIYLGYKTILPGLLLNHKGDRVAMANSVETRYPFLDDEVVQYCARLHPSWKLWGIRGDKYALRMMAAEFLPREVAWRPKAMFRAPLRETFVENPPPYVGQLLSKESIRKTGYFDAERLHQYYYRREELGWRPGQRTFLDLGLTGVIATQLWHHLYLGGGLCELPQWSPNLQPLQLA